MPSPSPVQCKAQQAAVDKLQTAIRQLTAIFNALQHAHGQDAQTKLAKAEDDLLDAQTQLAAAQKDLDACVKLHPVQRPDGISTDTTPVPRTQVVSLAFLQTKFDEFFNNRAGDPIFKLRFHNDSTVHTDPPRSFVEYFFIIPSAPPTGTGPLGTSYKSLGVTDLGQLDAGYYFDDLNSNSVKVGFFFSDAAPLHVTIGFETDGPVELPNIHVLTFNGQQVRPDDLDLSFFSITIYFALSSTQLDLLSWVPEYIDIINKLTPIDASVFKPVLVHGTFLGKPVNQIMPRDVVEDFFASQVVFVDLTAKGSKELPGGAIQKRIRLRIFDFLVNETNRSNLNAYARRWVLGGEGNYDITGFTNNGETISVQYQVPKNKVTPFSMDWPSDTNLPSTPAKQGSTTTSTTFTPGTLANINHIVVLTMENRSFDHMLGYLSLPLNKGGMGRTDVDGLKFENQRITTSNTYNGTTYPSFPLAPGVTVFSPDPEHDSGPVSEQIDGGTMNGFVKSYATEAGEGAGDGSTIMGYHTAANVPVFDALARDFAICHRWFASHPGPTFCNRFYEFTGRLNLTSALDSTAPNGIDPSKAGFWEYVNSIPLTPVFTKTIFDYLSEHKVTWNCYEHFYCFLRFFAAHTFDNVNVSDPLHANIVNVNDPFHGFFANAKGGTLPAVSFIDPHYIELPPGGSDDGPPADIREGQLLVQKVVEAVVASPKWNETLLIIVYDEHGGFYDHVPPPEAVKVTQEAPTHTFGVRVPAFIISPWTISGQQVFGHDASGTQASLYFDHTSILKTIARRFMSASPPYMFNRYAAAKDLSSVLGNTLRHNQFLPFIRYSLMYNDSKRVLDLQGGNAATASTAGTMLLQSDKSDSDTQNFSFEDAGGGFVYIRTHPANLYVTVNRSDGTVSTGGPGGTAPVGIKQDVKYNPTGVISTNSPVNPALQKWKLTPAAGSVGNPQNMFVISSASLPDKVLQPVNNAAGAAVVLGDKSAAAGPLISPNIWHVSSPLISVGADHV